VGDLSLRARGEATNKAIEKRKSEVEKGARRKSVQFTLVRSSSTNEKKKTRAPVRATERRMMRRRPRYVGFKTKRTHEQKYFMHVKRPVSKHIVLQKQSEGKITQEESMPATRK